VRKIHWLARGAAIGGAACRASLRPVGQDDWLSATLSEAWADFTLLLVVGFVVAVAIRSRAARATRSRASMRGTGFLLVVHLASLPLLGQLAASGHPSYPIWRMVSITVATLAGIVIALAIVFDGLMRLVRVELPRIVQDVTAAAAFIVGGLFLLSGWGVNLGGLIATSAVLTAVIGFSLQDTLGNLMGGMALQMEKSIRPGDWIQVNDKVGRVLEVRWRQTTIETRDWETLVVPNSWLVKNQFMVLGRRAGQPVQLRIKIRFDIDYRFAPTDVVRTVQEALRRAPIEGVATEPAPDCVHLDMRGSFNTYAARYWLSDLTRDEPVDSRVRTRVFFALRRAGIPLTMPAQAIFMTNENDERRQRKARDKDESGAAVLRRAELFRDLSAEEIDELACGLRYAPYSAAETLTRQGTQGDELYFIHSGEVGVRMAANGVERELATLGPGNFFGERSLMTGEPRSATTVAKTDVECYRLAKADFEKILKRRPELADALAETLARREGEMSTHRDSLAHDHEHIASEKRRLGRKIRSFFGL
jgi:small-conductance mechanosensitive channel/CRP-like cAMP-binding protein